MCLRLYHLFLLVYYILFITVVLIKCIFYNIIAETIIAYRYSFMK